ncbi:MAG: hypothetical protein COW02_02590 [Comamonadaceae bacterium CG12_big_fil_rev_8_21_14_0_65_59_15]|nr:MAG: hypothetical protein COW02_02590 [Comamonadaceae bacterium CG12_big_fil_rev_8_21_14_0_65_59_15]
MSNLFLLDSISCVDARHAQSVVVSGSHGGVSAAQFVLSQAAERPRAVFFNDAGVGKQEAGIAALKLLEAANIAAATYSHDSACIGNAQDAWDHGVISHVNPQMQARGVRPGQTVQHAAANYIV